MKRWMIFPLLLLCVGCSAPKVAMTSSDSQVLLREAQTRDYDCVTTNQAMRASIATLQDLSFVLDKIDGDLGTITATKYRNCTMIKVTIVVRERACDRVSIRMNASYGQKTVDDPMIYQDFFVALDKSLFLVKNRVN